MRKIFVCSLFFVSFCSFAQQNVINSTGNVGIGTTSPTTLLDVNGWTRLRAGLEMPTNTDFIWNAYYAGGWKYRANGFAGGFYQDGSGNLVFNVAPSGNTDGILTFNRAFTVLNNGNVGIGISSPAYKLDVNGSSRTNGTHYVTGAFDGNARLVFLPNSTGNTWEEYPTTGGFGLYDRTNSLFRYFIANNGNIGIGTTTPNRKLVVDGEIGLGYGDGLSYNGIKRNGVATEYFNGITSGTSSIIHRFTGSGNVDKMVISEGGNVGIGTVSPLQTLHVNGGSEILTTGSGAGFKFRDRNSANPVDWVWYSSENVAKFWCPTSGDIMSINVNGLIGVAGNPQPGYKFAVNGSIKAKEVKVSTQNWADFVFGNDYKLPALTDVEAFIKENKHLPEIPSEKEVLENGFNLGEMNVKLLQKVEELTLYIIEEKKIREKEVRELKKEIDLLKQNK